MAFVLGLVTIFAAGSASAQARLKFETNFDFYVGKEKLAAGTYEFQNISAGTYSLRNVETTESRIVYFNNFVRGSRGEKAERIIFNRYGATYFLNGLFENRDADGRQIVESNLEKQIRKNGGTQEDRLAGGKVKPEKVSVSLSK